MFHCINFFANVRVSPVLRKFVVEDWFEISAYRANGNLLKIIGLHLKSKNSLCFAKLRQFGFFNGSDLDFLYANFLRHSKRIFQTTITCSKFSSAQAVKSP
jgi:hypothetical protein